MKTLITLLAAVALIILLSGCSGTVKVLAAVYDGQDPCQQNAQPNFCGASAGRTVIYSTPQGQPLGAPIGYTKNR